VRDSQSTVTAYPRTPPRASRAMPAEPTEKPMRIKMFAYVGLVTIQVSISLMYRVSQTDKRSFAFNPASAMTMAEFCKLLISCNFLIAAAPGASFPAKMESAIASAKQHMTRQIFMSVGVLALLYCFNNNLQFVINTMADPGSILLVKNSSTFVSAIFLVVFVKRYLSSHQWVAILLQIAGLVVTQWKACSDRAALSNTAYTCMFISAMCTAVCQVWNENQLKSFKVDMHLQNATLYFCGVVCNLITFFFIPSPAVTPGIGFFEGYNTFGAIGVVVSNSLIGLAITAVYKYCDVMMKTFATANSTVIMVVVSAIFFGADITFISAVGVFVVIAAIYLYVTSPKPPPSDEKTAATVISAGAGQQKIVGAIAVTFLVFGTVIFTAYRQLKLSHNPAEVPV